MLHKPVLRDKYLKPQTVACRSVVNLLLWVVKNQLNKKLMLPKSIVMFQCHQTMKSITKMVFSILSTWWKVSWRLTTINSISSKCSERSQQTISGRLYDTAELEQAARLLWIIKVGMEHWNTSWNKSNKRKADQKGILRLRWLLTRMEMQVKLLKVTKRPKKLAQNLTHKYRNW